MPEELAPPVVVVVVSHDPGPWLEACLESIQTQDYPNLSVLVVDAASEPELAPRVAAVAPSFYLSRLEENRGFGPSANAVRGMVEGATHFLFCHDDVVLSPDALRRMVEEAFRQNAGIVGPKFVDPDEPDRILQLGLGVDRFGAPVRRVERGEFDQAQHDEVQETFAVPGGCTLVRADLFDAVGGYDEQISMFGEDVDFCWRARLAGARALVVPQAVVGHLEATSARRRELREARALQWRHELRVVMKNYGRLRRAIVLSELALWSFIEVLYFLARGRPSRARQVRDAWRWNFQQRPSLVAARNQVESTRRISDYELRSLFTRRTFRVWRFVQPRIEEALLGWSASGATSARRELERLRHSGRRSRTITSLGALLVLVFVFGSRSLLVGHLPVIGGFLPVPSAPSLIGRFLGGVPANGVGQTVPASPAFLLLGLAGLALIGAMGVLLKLCCIAAIIFGAVGVARLVRPFASPGARLAAASAYLFLPLCWNDVATGDVLALVAYGGAPYLLARLLRATGVSPFSEVGGSRHKAIVGELLGFSLLLALLGSFVPVLAILTPVLAGAIALGCAALGEWRAGVRSLLVSIAALFGALVLTFPWSITYLQRGASWGAVLGASTDPARAPQLGAVVRLELGPFGAGPLGLALFVAALFVMLAARGDRYKLAVVIWAQLLAAIAITWAATEGWLGSGGGTLRVLAAPIACAIAVEVGLGCAIVVGELVHSGFGWRHLGAVGFGVLAVLGSLPILGASLSGRYDVPGSGIESVLSWLHPASGGALQRVLFLGDEAALPGGSIALTSSVAAVVSTPTLPDATALIPGANVAALHSVVGAVRDAESGTTVRLGSALAADAIRYVVVPTASAPLLGGTTGQILAPPPQLLLDALTAQSDLHELPNEAGILVFENTDWHSGIAPRRASLPAALRSLGVAAELALLIGLCGVGTTSRRRRRSARRAAVAKPIAHVEPSAPEESVLVGGER